MIVEYDKISIVVFAEKQHLDSMMRLFRFLIGGKINHSRHYEDCHFLYGEKFTIRIAYPREEYKGWRAHYVLNTVQDKCFNEEIARPMSHIHNFLDKDVWKELFI